jgi:hypothetical protein
MPSRPVTAAILLLWVLSTGWMLQREVLSRMGTHEPPPLHFDLADDVSDRLITWKIYRGEELIGNARSTIKRKEDRTFELGCEHQYYRKFGPTRLADIKKVASIYRVTMEGDLVEMSMSIKAQFTGNMMAEQAARGTVKDGKLHMELDKEGFLVKFGAGALIQLKPVDVPPGTTVLNTMHPLHRITGLWEGRRWKVPVFNPIKFDFALLAKEPPEPIAEVASDTITWRGEEVDCWRIDYTDTKKDERIGHTWVRCTDGLVLRQEASLENNKLTLERESAR